MRPLHLVLFTLAALLSLGAGCLPEDTADVPQFPTVAYTAQQIDVRELPEVNASVIARLPQGAAVSVGSCGSGWCGIATAELAPATDALASSAAPALCRPGSPAGATAHAPCDALRCKTGSP